MLDFTVPPVQVLNLGSAYLAKNASSLFENEVNVLVFRTSREISPFVRVFSGV